MSIFRIKSKDTIKAFALNLDGKILSSIYDSNFTKISEVQRVLLSKIPYYNGKKIEIRITNVEEEKFKTYYIKSNQ